MFTPGRARKPASRVRERERERDLGYGGAEVGGTPTSLVPSSVAPSRSSLSPWPAPAPNVAR